MFSLEQIDFLHSLNNKYLPPLDMSADDYNDNIDGNNFFGDQIDILSEDSPLHSTVNPHPLNPEMKHADSSGVIFNDHPLQPPNGYPDAHGTKKNKLGQQGHAKPPQKSASEILSALMKRNNDKTPLVLPPLRALLPPQQYDGRDMMMSSSQPMIADPFAPSSSSSNTTSGSMSSEVHMSCTTYSNGQVGLNQVRNDNHHHSSSHRNVKTPTENFSQRNFSIHANQQSAKLSSSSSSSLPLNNTRKMTPNLGLPAKSHVYCR